MKKIKFLLLAAVMGAASVLGACGRDEKISYPDGKPAFTTEREMFIGAFCSPNPSDEAYALVAESGINHMVTYAHTEIGMDSPDFYKAPFESAGKNGVKIIPNTSNQPWTAFAGTQYIKNWTNKHADTFGGVNVFDEPSANEFPELKRNLGTYQEKYSDYPYYVNLFPIYATPAQLATETYEEYVSLYTEELLKNMTEGKRYMVCDIYPLLKQSQMLGNWLRNLEILKKYTDIANGEMYIYIQSIGFSNRRQPAAASDLKFQSYVSMAYGATGIYHFTYLTPFWDKMYTYSHGLVNKDGTTTEVYDFAKESNNELLAFDDVFLDFKWKKVVSSIGSLNLVGENQNFSACEDLAESYGALTGVESEQDTIVGCFENAGGYQGFMAVNFTDPTLKKTNKVTLSFGGGVNKALVYVKGAESEVELTEGKLELNLAPGEGVFAVPYKG